MARIKETMKCRFYHLELSDQESTRHFDILREFILRGIKSPRGGSCGPIGDGRVFVVHYLNEEVADEYELKMGMKK